MKYAIVYSSRTGNTQMLAEALREALPREDCIYYGIPNPAALEAERIYVGFWTDRGSCDGDTAAFLQGVTCGEVFLFGTAGFGENQAYYEKILRSAGEHISAGVSLAGSFMCQGKMPMSVRERYEKMMESPEKAPNLPGLIANFDKALSHPDSRDLEALRKRALSAY